MPFNGSTWVPYTEFTNGSIADMGSYNSSISGDAFGVGLLVLIYIAFLAAGVRFTGSDPIEVNAGVSFLVWAVSLLMVGMESTVYNTSWLPQEATYATTVIMMASVAMLYFGRR